MEKPQTIRLPGGFAIGAGPEHAMGASFWQWVIEQPWLLDISAVLPALAEAPENLDADMLGAIYSQLEQVKLLWGVELRLEGLGTCRYDIENVGAFNEIVDKVSKWVRPWLCKQVIGERYIIKSRSDVVWAGVLRGRGITFELPHEGAYKFVTRALSTEVVKVRADAALPRNRESQWAAIDARLEAGERHIAVVNDPTWLNAQEAAVQERARKYKGMSLYNESDLADYQWLKHHGLADSVARAMFLPEAVTSELTTQQWVAVRLLGQLAASPVGAVTSNTAVLTNSLPMSVG